MTGKRAHDDGYALIEVLIAFAIMAGVLIILLPQQAKLFTRNAESGQRYHAHEFALSKLDEIGVSKPIVVGQTAELYRDWNFETRTIGIRSELSSIKNFRVIVSISSSNGSILAKVEKRVSLETEATQ